MIQVEQDYKELVGDEGYLKVRQVADLWELPDSARELFFSALLNAYWRGANMALDNCRKVLFKKGTVDESGKPTN